MKKRIIALFTVIFMLFSFTACKKESLEKKVVGTWKAVYAVYPQKERARIEDLDQTVDMVFVLHENKTADNYFDGINNDPVPSFWKIIEPDTVYLYDENNESVDTFTYKDNELHLKMSIATIIFIMQ